MTRKYPSRILLGEYVEFNGKRCKVVTVQKGCPRIENLRNTFTMFVLEMPNGEIVLTDRLHGLLNVWKDAS